MGMEVEGETFGRHDSESAGDFRIKWYLLGDETEWWWAAGNVMSLSFLCGSKISFLQSPPMRWSVRLKGVLDHQLLKKKKKIH